MDVFVWRRYENHKNQANKYYLIYERKAKILVETAANQMEQYLKGKARCILEECSYS